MNHLYPITADTEELRVPIYIRDATTFMGLTGLAFDTAGFSMSYSNGPNDIAHDIALVTNTVGGAWSSGGFVEIDSTKQPGWYQLDIPNVALVSGAGNIARVVWKGTGVLDDSLDFRLLSYNPDAVDKTGYSLSSAALLAIWNQLTSGMATVGSIGKLLADNIASTKTDTAAIKTKTDALILSSGKVKLAPDALDSIPGYHPAGDA